MSPDEKSQFLTTNRISYVFLGPRERALNGLWAAEWGVEPVAWDLYA
jgi:hypothetical protein